MEVASGAAEPANTLARLFGIAESPTLDLLERLVGLGGLVSDPNPPEESWLSAAGHSGAVRAQEALCPLLIECKSRESQLADVFTEEVLELDLRRLKARFDSVHTGLRKVGPAYRKDRRQLAGAALSGKFTKALIDSLPDAVSWQEVRRKLTSTEAEQAEAIGDHYWPPGFDQARTLIERLDETIGDVDEWAAFVTSRDELVQDGLDQIVEAAIQQNFADDQVEEAIERSVLQSWIDHLLQADDRLRHSRAIDRVLHHRRQHPNPSIGVVTLSQPQQVAIEDRIFERREAEPELNDLQYDDRLAGFFVKNLENVQGDERDIMILSVGYGPDEHGRLTMNFGPMNYRGGERRLNVAVTRARCRFEVVCSIDPDSITDGNPTLGYLRRYLNYARRRGVAVPEVDPGGSRGDPESPFEEEVLGSLRRLGHAVEPQVGAAGYRIDIGVRHPRRPGAYLLGVECDGASYHSSLVARDRDRLRQDVLEGLGWTIHRIWSASWFNDRRAEERRLDDFIRDLLDDHGPADGPTGPASPADESPDPAQDVAQPPEVEVEVEAADFSRPPDWTVAYEEPRQPVGNQIARRFSFTDRNARPHICEMIEGFLSNNPYHVHWDVVRQLV
ncbi:MAG: AAA domain-containing protein [bacterium]|nr:AAA domain-containing protein [bacterium]